MTSGLGQAKTVGLSDEAMESKKPRKSKMNKNWTPQPDDDKPRRTIKAKGRLSVRKKGKTLDSHHLGVNDDDHMNDSWESGRDSAQNFDMTNQLPKLGGSKPAFNATQNSMFRASLNLGLPQSRQEDDVQSYQSVHEELNQIEDVID